MEDRYRVRMGGIKKGFGDVEALSGVSLAVRPGKIHTLMGENGAGKSTLMRILSGAYQRDEGTIKISDVSVEVGSPCRGKELGAGITYQEFELAGDLTVTENVLLNWLDSGKLIDWKRLYEKAEAVLHSLDFDISIKDRMQGLNVAYQQVVEIIKIPSQNAKILILNKPTAVLNPKEAAVLFETLNKLYSEGVSIIYIPHRMEKIFQITDSITITRDGEVTGTGRHDQVEMDQATELMIDRRLFTMFPPRAVEMDEEIPRVEELEGEAFRQISFSVRRGEVLDILGLVGNGRDEIVRVIFDTDRKKSGKVYLNGQEVTIHFPEDAVRFGIGLTPKSRKKQGLVLDLAIKHNITVSSIRSVRGSLGVIRQGQENRLAQSLVEKLTVKTDSVDAAVHQLSGGNQQKVVLAKQFNAGSQMVIFGEPARGMDVGVKIEVYNSTNEFAKRGLGVIIISFELNEIIDMCDRTIVIDNGEKKGEPKEEELSELSIIKLAAGGNVK